MPLFLVILAYRKVGDPRAMSIHLKPQEILGSKSMSTDPTHPNPKEDSTVCRKDAPICLHFEQEISAQATAGGAEPTGQTVPGTSPG